MFKNMQFSISNLHNTGVETLNQLDVDGFLYATSEYYLVDFNVHYNVVDDADGVGWECSQAMRYIIIANLTNKSEASELLPTWPPERLMKV